MGLAPSSARALDEIEADGASRGAYGSVHAPHLGFELPLGFRVRVGRAPDGERVPDGRLASRRSERPDADDDPDLGGSVALTHDFGRAVELGIAWSGRGDLSRGAGIDLERHFFGAIFRIAH